MSDLATQGRALGGAEAMPCPSAGEPEGDVA